MKPNKRQHCRAFILTAFLMAAGSSQAAIWQVNNNAGVKADFTTLQKAHDAAQAGDTLYMHGSPNSYGNLNATKRLSIYGPGYLLSENRDKQANVREAQAGRIEFLPGSGGSLVSGLRTGTIFILANDVTVKRNRTGSIGIGGAAWDSRRPGVANVLILQNYSDASYDVYNSERIIIRNNFQANEFNSGLEVSGGSDVFVEQNLIHGGGRIAWHEGTTVQNNLLRTSPNATRIQGSTFRNNLIFGDRTDLFLKTSNRFIDSDWQLSENSPARRAGINGEDLGPFGGNDPYVLSGIPSIPAIYSFTAPGSVTSHTGLRVQLKARANR